jgi:hypothetical protein
LRSSRRVRREHIEEGNGVTDIGVPDPVEPEIDVIPAVEPVPGFVEEPEPAPAQEREPGPA